MSKTANDSLHFEKLRIKDTGFPSMKNIGSPAKP